jgi:hypothetical protein
MRTLKDKDDVSIGILGEFWAQNTRDLIKGAMICSHVSVFEYTEREALFFDQYDFFIITDFGKDPSSGDEGERIVKLNQMREIIATRSMKTVMFANNDDPDISTSLREACCRLIRVDRILWNQVPFTFAELLLWELCGKHDYCLQKHHSLPSPIFQRALAS